MNYGYSNHLELAEELFKFAEECSKTNDTIHKRMMCGRLYYAIYHKAIYDNPDSKFETSNSHAYIRDNIDIGEMNSKLYKDLYYFRRWADYKIEGNKNIVKLHNFFQLYKKLFNKNNKLKVQPLKK